MNNYHEEEILGKAYDSRLMKRLLKYMKPYKFYVILALGLMLIYTALNLVEPYILKIAIDNYFVPAKLNGLFNIVLLFFGILIFQFVAQVCQDYLLQWIGQKILLDLRNEIYKHLQSLSLSYFIRNPVGRLVTRVTTDVEALNQLFSSGIVAIFGDIFLLLGIIIVLLKIHFKLALLTFSVLPVVFIITMIFRKHIREGFRDVRIRIAKINSYMQENISGMTIVQLFNREKKNFNKFDLLNNDHMEAHLRTILYFAIFYPIIELISAIICVCIN